MIKIWMGLYFDEASWDGSDVFRPLGTAHVLVTQRVKDLLEKSKMTNLRFEALTSIEKLEVEMQM